MAEDQTGELDKDSGVTFTVLTKSLRVSWSLEEKDAIGLPPRPPQTSLWLQSGAQDC